MDEKVIYQDIDRSRCLGNKKPNKSNLWPIIIKFWRYNIRIKIFKNKKKIERKMD